MPAVRRGRSRVLTDTQGPSARRPDTQSSTIRSAENIEDAQTGIVEPLARGHKVAVRSAGKKESSSSSRSPRRTRSGGAKGHAVAKATTTREAQPLRRSGRREEPARFDGQGNNDDAALTLSPRRVTSDAPSASARLALRQTSNNGSDSHLSNDVASTARRPRLAQRPRRKVDPAVPDQSLSGALESPTRSTGKAHSQQYEEGIGEDTVKAGLPVSPSSSAESSGSDKENVPLAFVSRLGKGRRISVMRNDENCDSLASSSLEHTKEQQHSTPIAAKSSQQPARQSDAPRRPLSVLHSDDKPQTYSAGLSILDAYGLGSRLSSGSNVVKGQEGEEAGLNLGTIPDQLRSSAGLNAQPQLLSQGFPKRPQVPFRNFHPPRRSTVKSPLAPSDEFEGAFEKLRRERPQASSTKENVARMFAASSSAGRLGGQQSGGKASSSGHTRSSEVRLRPGSQVNIATRGQPTTQAERRAPPAERVEDESMDLDDPFGFEEAEERLRATRAAARLVSEKKDEHGLDGQSASDAQQSSGRADGQINMNERDTKGKRPSQRMGTVMSSTKDVDSQHSQLPDVSTLAQSVVDERMEHGAEQDEVSAELVPIRRSTRRRVPTSVALQSSSSASSRRAAAPRHRAGLAGPTDKAEIEIAFSQSSSSSLDTVDSESETKTDEQERMSLDRLVELLPKGPRSFQKHRKRRTLGNTKQTHGRSNLSAVGSARSAQPARSKGNGARTVQRRLDHSDSGSSSGIEALQLSDVSSAEATDGAGPIRRRRVGSTARKATRVDKSGAEINRAAGKSKSSAAGSSSSVTRPSTKSRGTRRVGKASGTEADAASACVGAQEKDQDTPRTRARKNRIKEMEDLDKFQLESELVI